MAFVKANLTRHSHAGNSGRLHFFAVADTAAQCVAANYFNPAVNELNVRDVITIIGAGSTTLDDVFVSAINRTTGVVTIIGAEGITAT